MPAFRVNLAALKNNGGSASATVDLGGVRRFLAWGSVTMIDSLNDFDRDNAVAFDIFTIDGAKTPTAVFGGDHWGPLGSGNNVYQGAWSGVAASLTCGYGQSTPMTSTRLASAASLQLTRR
jgi:hypothetical protein